MERLQYHDCRDKDPIEHTAIINIHVRRLRVTIILHAILCILSLHHNRRPNPAICLFQSLIILCQIKLSR